MIKIIGYILLAVSCLLFIMIPVVPWFDFSKTQSAVILIVLMIACEVLLYLILFILGRMFVVMLNSRLKFWKAKPADMNLPDQNEQK